MIPRQDFHKAECLRGKEMLPGNAGISNSQRGLYHSQNTLARIDSWNYASVLVKTLKFHSRIWIGI